MMKKTILPLWLIVSMCVFVACGSDDDEDDYGTMSEQVGYLFSNSPKRIKRVGNIYFEYYDSGKIKSVSKGKSVAYYFSEEGEAITTYANTVTQDYQIEFKFTKSGYISRVANNYSNVQHSNTVTYSYGYDRSGHLTSGSAIGEERDYDGSVSRGSAILSLTWNNNLLVKVTRTQEMKREYDTSSTKMVWNFEYDEAPQNVFAQVPPIMVEEFLGIEAYLGLLGRGPSLLPTRIIREEYDRAGNKNSSYPIECRYELNEDGSLKNCYSSEDGYKEYEYEEVK